MFFILGSFCVSAKWSDAVDFPCREYTNVLYGSKSAKNCKLLYLHAEKCEVRRNFAVWLDVTLKVLSNEMDNF
jgi:hypothetical protein